MDSALFFPVLLDTFKTRLLTVLNEKESTAQQKTKIICQDF